MTVRAAWQGHRRGRLAWGLSAARSAGAKEIGLPGRGRAAAHAARSIRRSGRCGRQPLADEPDVVAVGQQRRVPGVGDVHQRQVLAARHAADGRLEQRVGLQAVDQQHRHVHALPLRPTAAGCAARPRGRPASRARRGGRCGRLPRRDQRVWWKVRLKRMSSLTGPSFFSEAPTLRSRSAGLAEDIVACDRVGAAPAAARRDVRARRR